MDPSPMGMGGGMPPMPPMGDPTPSPDPMGGSAPDPMGDPMGNDKSYDADFDAGVDTNEEDDPKKFIQQLTGKLSQSLNKYQDTLPEPDVELDKYVASMTIAATTKGLDEKDVNAIYKKLKDKGGDVSDESDDDNDTPTDENDDMSGDMGGMNNMQTESVHHHIDRIVNEVCREVLQTKDCILDRNNSHKKSKNNPYTIPKFSKRK